MAAHFWHFRSTNDPPSDILAYYQNIPELFTVKLHRSGYFNNCNKTEYVGGQIVYVDCVDVVEISSTFLDKVMTELGHDSNSKFYYYWRKPNEELPQGLSKLETDNDVQELLSYIGIFEEIDVYVLNEDMREVASPMLRRRSNLRNETGNSSRRLNF